MALIGKIEEFLEGREEWSQYVERLDLYFKANDITSEGKKQATLLTVIGPSSYKLLRNLVAPTKPSVMKYDDLVAAMNAHHCLIPSEIVQRCKFNSRFRMDNETIAGYMASLRSLAEFCNFGTSLDVMLRDRLVCGVRDDRIQRRLLAEKSLNLGKAVELATSIEMAANNVRDLQTAQAPREEVHQMASSPQPKQARARTCFRCGKGGHTSDKCRFKDSNCHHCQKRGHISSVCLSKRRGIPPKSSGQVKALKADDDDAGTESADESSAPPPAEYGNLRLYRVDGKSNVPPLKVKVNIDSQEVGMEIDTGASISLMSETTFRTYWPKRRLSPTTMKLRTYTNHELEVVGVVEVYVAHNGQVKTLPLIVVKEDGPSLLGRSWLHELRLDWASVHNMNAAATTDVNDILQRHDAVFREELGKFTSLQATLHVNKDAAPRFCKARVVPYAMRDLVEKELEKLQHDGVIEPVQFSEWAAP
ncbi:uncharacterized protein [Diadema antillarum]|uniref:uncharacterized protein n=1 Tax=Diadema antillarum TaxID=105358 RepID=UPI003A8C3FC0